MIKADLICTIVRARPIRGFCLHDFPAGRNGFEAPKKRCCNTSEARVKQTDMEPSVQTLVQQTFSLGPYKQTRALGKAAQFTWKFGAFVFVLGLAFLLFPEKLGGITETGSSAPGQRFAQQNSGIVIMVVGYFYFIAGRNNAEWFFAGSILDRMVASTIVFFLFVTGSATLAQVAGQIALDVGSAIYTYKLYQEDLADKQL
ncbi:hypothetical protein WJX82_005506 [Trebouxia sp. C0006]